MRIAVKVKDTIRATTLTAADLATAITRETLTSAAGALIGTRAAIGTDASPVTDTDHSHGMIAETETETGSEASPRIAHGKAACRCTRICRLSKAKEILS